MGHLMLRAGTDRGMRRREIRLSSFAGNTGGHLNYGTRAWGDFSVESIFVDDQFHVLTFRPLGFRVELDIVYQLTVALQQAYPNPVLVD